MDEDLNVGNLLETRAERAPRTQSSEPRLLTPTHKHKHAFPVGLAIAAVVAVAILIISGKTGRRVHVMERY
jgi:hypothetical protein